MGSNIKGNGKQWNRISLMFVSSLPGNEEQFFLVKTSCSMLSFVVVFVIVIYQFQSLDPTWPRILWAVWRRVSHWHPSHPPATPTTLYQAVMLFLNIELSLKAWSLRLPTSHYLLTIISGLQAVIVETLGPDQPHQFHTIWANYMVSCMFSIFLSIK